MEERRDSLLVIEPNLRNESGHYAEFVRALGQGAARYGEEIEVFADPEADNLLSQMPGIRSRPRRNQSDKQISEFRVIARSVKNERPFMILTSDGRHTAVAHLGSLFNPEADLSQAIFYFHRMPNGFRKWLMQRSRNPQKHALAVTPTEKVASDLRKAGWQNVRCLPYPAAGNHQLPDQSSFRHILTAGVARVNKGLDLIARMLKLWKEEKRDLPLLMQIAPKKAKKHGSKEEDILQQIQTINYPGLVLDDQPASRELYTQRFRGALVLAPYHRDRFAHAVSGVVLDALLNGAPVIATSRTWPGNQVERFGAGICIETHAPQELSDAVDRILADWNGYSKAAREAALVLAEEHDPAKFFAQITRRS